MGESAQFLAGTLEKLLAEDAGSVLIELSRINYIDSTGIGELVGYFGKFKERGRRLVLIQPAERIRKLLEVAKLDTVFPVFDSVEAALAAASA
jgi:anti-sigma B factor antagonist